ncbi:MAG: ADOP family duplicated permease, partial [Gemmatimonadaceae bacterium]|nr:ADOP family duplicated permease [Gemmatimonadaceae bacterium]
LLNVAGVDRPVRLFGVLVSADYFTVLGVRPALGRLYVPADEDPAGPAPGIVLSDATWRNHFGADPAIVGRRILVNGVQLPVLGVTPPDFAGVVPLVRPAFYLAIRQLAAVLPGEARNLAYPENSSLYAIARIREGVSLAQVEARTAALSRALEASAPGAYRGRGINVVPQSRAGIYASFRTAQVGLSAVVMAVVGLLLLIACVNVANLFLARAGARSREMAIRLALGARRGLLLRQLLVESTLFALLGGVAGLIVAAAAIALANRIPIPIDFDVRPDLRLSPTVLAFALVVSLGTAVLFGVAPALQATQPALTAALKGALPSGGARNRLSRALVIVQMALSIVLLVCAALFARSLRTAASIDTGFAADHRLTAEVSFANYTAGRAAAFHRGLRERLLALPAVRAVGLVEELPLGLNNSTTTVSVPGYVPAKDETMFVQFSIASPAYFAAMGTPIVRGREFGSRDEGGGGRVVIVNQRFAERYWPGLDPIGRTVRSGDAAYTVVGVVPTGKYTSLGEAPSTYLWFRHDVESTVGMTVVVHTRGDPAAFAPTLRRIVGSLDPLMPVSNVRTLESHLGIALLPSRLVGGTLAVFGALGLVLASVGMYGVVAHGVAQRTREIGVRLAIGATGRQVVRLMMADGLRLVLIGAAIGVAAAVLVSRLLTGMLHDAGGSAALLYAVVPTVLVAVAAAATLLPARRAAAIDPAVTLRAE